jgi:hypothetical protein
MASLAVIARAGCRIHRRVPDVSGVLESVLLCAIPLAGSLLLGRDTWTRTSMMGTIIFPNLIVITVFVLLTATGWWLGRGHREISDDGHSGPSAKERAKGSHLLRHDSTSCMVDHPELAPNPQRTANEIATDIAT